MYHSRPLTDVEAVITAAELANFTGADVSDPLLDVFSVLATATVIEYLQIELINRARVATFQDWPTSGTRTGASLSLQDAALCYVIALPYANLFDDTLVVTVGGDVVDATDYRIQDTKPSSILFHSIPVFTVEDAPAIKLEYTAGFGATADDVPNAITAATLMLADFMYNNRGACSANDAVKASGAAALLAPYKTQVVIV